MSLVDVGVVDDFAEGIVRIVVVKKRDVGVLRWQGSWYALRNICPHLGGPLCVGPVNGFVTGEGIPWEGGQLVSDRSRPIVTCPWHRWEYDLTTGHSLIGNERIRTYRVEVSNGRVAVDLSQSVRSDQPAGAALP